MAFRLSQENVTLKSNVRREAIIIHVLLIGGPIGLHSLFVIFSYL